MEPPSPPVYPTRSKEASLPVQRTELGFVQHTLYRHPDLWHEAVIELDSPFASVFASDTAIFSFLVLGDQNAGKSTFLHAFTYHEDRNFLELTSVLPILTSSFVNSRFLVNSAREPRDELPFLDTDIARGTFLLSLEDFYFFLNEYNLPLETVPDTTRFALIQFIEIGGDHLDLMMHPQHSTITEIAQRSSELLKGTRRTIYFANCATLFAREAGSSAPSLVVASLSTLKARLAYLSKELQPPHEVLVYLSRPPAEIDLRSSCAAASEVLELTAAELKQLLDSANLIDFVRSLLALLSLRNHWSITIGGIYEARHLHVPDQTLGTEVLVEMISQLFRHHMMGQDRGTEGVVATHLLRCHKSLRERVDAETGELTLWITPEVFSEYLEHMHSSEIPESLLLQQLPLVAYRLAAGGLCITHEHANFSRTIVSFEIDAAQQLTWYPAGVALQSHSPATKHSVVIPVMKRARKLPTEAQIRFPLFSPLYDIVAFYFANNVPAGFWLADDNEAVRLHLSGPIAARLNAVLHHLQEEISHQWQKLCTSHAEKCKSSASVLVWLLEEWLLGTRLIVPEADASSSCTFPILLPTPSSFVTECLPTIFPIGPHPPCNARPSVHVRLSSRPPS